MKTLLMRNARCIATFDHAEPAHLTGCRIESNAPQVRREHAGPFNYGHRGHPEGDGAKLTVKGGRAS